MRHSEKVAPVAAVAGAISTMACCLPFGIFAGTAGVGLAAALERFRPYLMAASIAMILFGLWQLYRRRGASCARRSRVSIVLFWICAVVVAIMMMIPQIVADLLADLAEL